MDSNVHHLTKSNEESGESKFNSTFLQINPKESRSSTAIEPFVVGKLEIGNDICLESIYKVFLDIIHISKMSTGLPV